MSDAVVNHSGKCSTDDQGTRVTANPSPIGLNDEVLDLVCHMAMPLYSATHRSHWHKDEFYFCSRFCQHRFVSNPIAFVPRRDFFDEHKRGDNRHAAA